MVKHNASRDVQKSLQDAFQIFNEFADNLSDSYRVLESRIGELNQELVETHNEKLAELNEKERLASRLSDVINALPAGVVVIDGRGVIQDCNPMAIELLGEPLKGELWRNVIMRAFRQESPSATEVLLQNDRIVSISTCPLGREPGQIIQLFDVTETRSLQNAVERYKRLSVMGEVSAKLAHQIRTPLSSALLYTSQIAQNKLSEADRQKFADKSLARLRHLEKLVEDMLAFTRGSGQGQRAVDLADFLQELTTASESILESADATLQCQPPSESIPVYINPDAMLGVLQNLIQNAIQVCDKPNAEISISVELVQAHTKLPSVDIAVADNGPGIAEENLSRIFDPYFTTRSQGTGLGLAVAQSVVQGHGGSMWISQSNENGTTFVIRLPLAQQSEEHDEQNENLMRRHG